jgi:hypothetical protein
MPGLGINLEGWKSKDDKGSKKEKDLAREKKGFPVCTAVMS